MGKIQNAISGAVGSVAVGAIAEQKTKGLKKEIAGLVEDKATLEKDITGLTEQKMKQEKELYARDLEMEYVGASIDEQQQKEFQLEKKVQQLHSELKAKDAQLAIQREQMAMKANREGYQNRIKEKGKSSSRGGL